MRIKIFTEVFVCPHILTTFWSVTLNHDHTDENITEQIIVWLV